MFDLNYFDKIRKQELLNKCEKNIGSMDRTYYHNIRSNVRNLKNLKKSSKKTLEIDAEDDYIYECMDRKRNFVDGNIMVKNILNIK